MACSVLDPNTRFSSFCACNGTFHCRPSYVLLRSFRPVFPTTRRKLSDEVKNGSAKTCPETVPAELRRIVDKVVESFGTWTGGQLVDWSHRIGGPWDIVTHRIGFKWADKIPDSEIKRYFSENVIRRKDGGR